MTTVIVFGPTGNIGSVAAQTAQKHGAKVFLGMRDPSKSIRGLSSELEKTGGFERIYADLTKPESLGDAVKQSRATRAFIYAAHGSTDHMKSAVQALKSAGIEFVVFLSSYTITGEPEDVAKPDLIPYAHAQVELSLDEVFGRDHYFAVRPGRFATNLLRFAKGINEGEIKLYAPTFTMDFITPTDIGRVSGYVLAKGALEGQQRAYLYGPQTLTQHEGLELVAKVLGKEVKITHIPDEQATDHLIAHGTPRVFAEYMVNIMTKKKDFVTPPTYDGGKNITLYTGEPALSLEKWVEANKDLFDV